MERLPSQIAFVLEIDALKRVLRQTYILGGERRENSAEHSWQLAVMALVLAEHANAPVDVCRVMKMLLVHDVVEVDAGDTYVYDEAGLASKREREQAAAVRVFGLLPPDQAAELRAAWEEFEEGESADARFANALDRLMPVLHNINTGGRSWREHGITADRVLRRNGATMERGSRTLWAFAQREIDAAVGRGALAPAARADGS